MISWQYLSSIFHNLAYFFLKFVNNLELLLPSKENIGTSDTEHVDNHIYTFPATIADVGEHKQHCLQ